MEYKKIIQVVILRYRPCHATFELLITRLLTIKTTPLRTWQYRVHSSGYSTCRNILSYLDN